MHTSCCWRDRGVGMSVTAKVLHHVIYCDMIFVRPSSCLNFQWRVRCWWNNLRSVLFVRWLVLIPHSLNLCDHTVLFHVDLTRWACFQSARRTLIIKWIVYVARVPFFSSPSAIDLFEGCNFRLFISWHELYLRKSLFCYIKSGLCHLKPYSLK